jgi:predicted TIM-barrel fold metal-dependent hydrolase
MPSVETAEATYAKGRFIYDADSHIVEWPNWLRDYAAPAMRERMPLAWTANDYAHLLREAGVDPGAGENAFNVLLDVHSSDAFRAKALENVMLQKQLNAFGAFRIADRSVALNQMGFRAQLVFNTFSNQLLQEAEASEDLELIREMSRAHNRAITDFCSGDRRLLATGYVPLSDLEGAAAIAKEAIDLGCRALIVASAAAPKTSPTHVALDPVWAIASEARVPVVFHVGGTGEVLHPSYRNNGRERTPDFRGGEGAMMSLRVLALPNPARAFLSAMVMDGIFMNFPNLMMGVFELGCSWMPSLLRELDAVARGFKSEPRITKLALKPSEYILRQVRVTPYPYEDVAWVIDQSSDDVCMFSSDYPHHEGGRDPLSRFDSWLKNASPAQIQKFYAGNFAAFIGGNLPGEAESAAA